MKTRLLGAFVLIALLVLFVPMFFPSSPPTAAGDQTVSLAIPPAPDRDLQTKTMSLDPDAAAPAAAASAGAVVIPAANTGGSSDQLATVDIRSRRPTDVETGDGASAIFVDTGTYTYSATHDFFNDLSGTYGDGGTNRASAETITSPTYTNGVFDGADTVFAAVNTSGTTVEGIVIFNDDTSADATSHLVAFFDSSITGAPFSTSSGAQVTIAWHASGIFSL